MPTYEFKCPVCKATRTVQCAIEERDRTTRCVECHYPMVRIPSAPNFTIHGYSASNGYSR